VEGRPPDDSLLVRRAKEGDVDAYAELVRMHQHSARRLAHVICGSSDDADEAAQDAFVKAWRALDRFRDGAPFRPFVLHIVANEARNRRRAAGRRAGYELRVAGDRASEEAAPSPEVAVLAGERRQALMTALATLSDGHREVIVCRHVLGMSEAETAGVLGLRAGTVKSRLARGLDHLREQLTPSVGSQHGV
jgi:RNA polymerase sigma-70 factor (ECF subfamily)